MLWILFGCIRLQSDPKHMLHGKLQILAPELVVYTMPSPKSMFLSSVQNSDFFDEPDTITISPFVLSPSSSFPSSP